MGTAPNFLQNNLSFSPRRRIGYLLIALRFALLLGLGLSSGTFAQTRGAERKKNLTEVPFRRVGAHEYQNFLRNWDDTKTPLLRALIDSPVRYASWFHPAPLNGANKRFCPEAAFFEREQILVVARVTPGVDALDGPFSVDRLEESDGELRLFYQFHKPSASSSYSVKAHLALSIPRKVYRRIVLIENGKQVAVLDLAAGEWTAPTPRDGPEKTEATP